MAAIQLQRLLFRHPDGGREDRNRHVSILERDTITYGNSVSSTASISPNTATGRSSSWMGPR